MAIAISVWGGLKNLRILVNRNLLDVLKLIIILRKVNIYEFYWQPPQRFALCPVPYQKVHRDAISAENINALTNTFFYQIYKYK